IVHAQRRDPDTELEISSVLRSGLERNCPELPARWKLQAVPVHRLPRQPEHYLLVICSPANTYTGAPFLASLCEKWGLVFAALKCAEKLHAHSVLKGLKLDGGSALK